ncbi:hypothetical protein D3C81_1821440 [compost metagenome]
MGYGQSFKTVNVGVQSADGRGQREYDVVVLHGEQILAARVSIARTALLVSSKNCGFWQGSVVYPATCKRKADS